MAKQNSTGDLLAIKEYFPVDYAERLQNGTVRATNGGKRVFDMGLETFLDEANMLKSLPRQSNLVRVRGAFSKAGTAYCLMDFIQGDPLDKILPRMIKHYGAVPESLIREFTLSMVSALTVVHNSHLVHRDVKPGNVMLRREDQQPVLIDFGAARPLRENASQTAMFTRRYAALEQFVGPVVRKQPGLKEGPWSDLFSLSVLLYEMVTRVPPHLDAEERLKAHLETGKDPYVPVAEMISKQGITANYSPQLMTLIDRGCALFPKDRPKDTRAYCDILGEPLPKVVTGPRSARNTTGGDPAQKIASLVKEPVRRSFGKLSGSLAMVLLILALALVSVFYGVMSQ
ncbi:MAG: protein kinase, partial [Pseudomonadota bacterium]